VINLTFHGIGPEPAGTPSEERWVWISETDFEAVLDAVAGRPEVRLTFDDANASDAEIALPALRERGLRATFFLVAGRIGESGFVDRDAVRALVAGGMELGCHGMEHRSWRDLPDDALDAELGAARRALERLGGGRVAQAACPLGAYDRRVLGELRRRGYERVFTSDGGRARPGAWLQPRNTLERDGAPAAVAELLRPEPAHRRLEHALKRTVKRLR
jgi:peptidoglycan/xylan/chitin deacetylase (PgdA/CDA1 family)